MSTVLGFDASGGNDIVVMDNCRIHLVPGIRERSRSAGDPSLPAKVLADLNPIEMSLQQIQDAHAQVARAKRSGHSIEQPLVHSTA